MAARRGWRSECRGEEVETRSKAVLSKQMAVNPRAGNSTHSQLRRQRVLRWQGCFFNFMGSEERAAVERVAEEKKRGQWQSMSLRWERRSEASSGLAG